MYKIKEKGITLIALIVTIIVLLILVGVALGSLLGDGGIIDRTKQSKFIYTITALEEYAQMQQVDKYFEEGLTNVDTVGNFGEVTDEEKDYILKNIPTLNDSVYMSTGETVYDRNLYWMDTKEALEETPDRRYIIDMDTLQVYQYEGTYFLKKMWHTLKGGIESDGQGGSDSGEDLPDGYMRIHLTYPEDSTDRQWRIGRPGESRSDGNLVWQDYTGDPILVKIDDIKNIWIRYNLKGVEVVEAPKGTLAVDIRINPTSPNQEKVTVDVYYENGSTNKKIKVGNGGWREYTGPFEVTENCTIEAMAEKEMNVADQNGNILGTTTVKGKDSYTITNIGEEEINVSLPTPIIEDVGVQGGTEKTTARVTYPDDQGDITKIYKVNSGVEQEYTGDIKINEWGTEVIAYYYTEAGDKSPEARKTFNDPTKLDVQIFVQPNPAVDESIKQTTVEIEYSEEATSKTYQIDNGPEQNYTGPIIVTNDCTITAYAKKTGVDTAVATERIEFLKKQVDKLNSPRFSQQDNSDKTAATVTINYDAKAILKQYSVNGGDLQEYTKPIENLKDGDIVYAYCENEEGLSADGTYTVRINQEEVPEEKLEKPRFSQQNNVDNTLATVTITYDSKTSIRKYSINSEEMKEYTEPLQNLQNGDVIYAYSEDEQGNVADGTYTVNLQKTQIKAPTFRQTNNSDNKSATVEITYDSNATTKQYSLNGNELTNYTGAIQNLQDGDVIYAINTDKYGESKDATYTVKIDETEFTAPIISPNYLDENSKVSISIKYDANAVTKKYSINGGYLKDYTGAFEVTENGTVIYAINTNAEGESKDTTYTVDGIIKKLNVKITVSPDTQETVEKVTVSIDYDANAKEKIYSINGGNSQNYTGPFDVTENCTIIAEAKAEDAYGQDTKQITNLPQGLAAPVITENKTIETEGEVANINITYDKNSISNTYSINTGTMQNYGGSFQIRENDTVINAYSVDKFGNSATSQYIVNDLVRYLLIDKGKYYWILLPFPEQSINRQYKYKTDGVWKAYKEDGFILVKSEYEDELIQGGKPIKLEVEPGRYVDFDGHWYILDTDPQKLQEDIYMKWDDPENTTTPKVPLQILAMPAPPEMTDKVDVFIIYPSSAIKKEYKIDNGTYQDYTGQLAITKNNTKVTARTQYRDGSWSEEVSYTVTNIDENIPPEGIVEIDASPKEWTKDNVTVTITYNPNSSVLKKKYKIGTEEWQYTNENEVTLTIENNTTIYAALENAQGQSSDAVTYNVENIDKEKPVITSFEATNIGTDSITVNVNATDEGSGIATYAYYQDNILKATTETNTYNYTGLTAGINYTFKVIVTDKVGLTTTKDVVVTTATPPGDDASIVANNPSEYYGAEVTGYTCTNSAAVSKWRIFYADSTNIYLIADDYIALQYAPNGQKGTKISNVYYKLSMDNVYKDYTGAEWINTNSKGKKWLSLFLNSYGTSTNESIRAVAYMMDTNVWGVYAGAKAEYAMGGPTIELFSASYKQTHPNKYVECNSIDEYGYKVKLNTDSSYKYVVELQDDFNHIYIKSDDYKADGMWIASPSSSDTYGFSSLINIRYSGAINCGSYKNKYLGFRPIVCLKSDVLLKKISDGVYAIQ